MKKRGFSRAASLFPVCYFQTLMKWSDIEYRKNAAGKWEVAQGCFSFNPIHNYIQQLDNILVTGEIGDHKTLCDLRADLSKLEEEFNKKNLDGLNGKISDEKFKDWFYTNEKGHLIATPLHVRTALMNADVRVIKFDSEYCRFTVREEKPRVHYITYQLSYPDAIMALKDLPIVPFRFFEKECDYSEDPIRGKKYTRKEVQHETN